ncbi:hypothetical protein JZU46_05135, partial [bacterium]|nr:hypothetical protein [bacterium]
TGAGITYQWYSNTSASNSGGTTLGSATGAQTASYTPLTTSVGVKYYYCIVSGTCSPTVTSTVSGAITINTIPVSGTLTPSVAAGGVCVGTSVSATLTAGSGGAGTVADVLQYKYDAGSWTTYTSGLSLTTTGHTSVSIQTYRTASASGCTQSTPVAVTWTVNALPTVAAITGTTTVCTSFTTTLSCTTASGAWSSNSANATVNSSGVVSGVSAGSATISYTVTNGTTNCSNASTAVVTVNTSLAAPTSVSATPATIQTGGTSNLNATSTNNTIYWYTAATGGSSVGSSASAANFSVSPSATTTYYAEANSTQSFYINTLTANNYAITDHNSYTGDDRGGIAVTSFYYYYVGDSYSVRYTMPNLTNPVSCAKRDGIFSDLGTGTLYTLHNGTRDPELNTNTGTFNVTNFRTLSADLATIGASAAVTLSSTVSMSSGSAAIYAGSNFVILQNGTSFYRVDIPSGTVTNMGSYSISRQTSESWATWGVAELNNGVYSVLYRENSTQAIKRLNLSTGAITTVATFTGLSDMCCFTYSPWHSKWYFHYESSSTQFGGTYETAGYADGTHTTTSTGCPSATRTAVTVTISDPPTVTTAAVSNINSTTATGGGNVTVQGGAEVTARGVCWSTSQTPIATGSHTTDGTGTGTFSSSITGLTAGTLYYVRAYATNTVGTSYGSQVSFTSYAPGSVGANQEICSGATPALLTSTTAAVGMPSVTYQWQSSANNSTYNDISGATSLTYQPGALSAATYYRRNAISGSVTLSSNVITVSINSGVAAPTAVTATPATILS